MINYNKEFNNIFCRDEKGRLMKGCKPWNTKQKLSVEHKKKISIKMKGIIFTEEHSLKKSISQIGDKNPNWKGDDVKSVGWIHLWVAKQMPKPLHCENCNEENKLELSCNDHSYKRKINNYQWLCLTCHRRKDTNLRKIRNMLIKFKLIKYGGIKNEA